MNYYTENTLIGIVTITEDRGFITSLYLCKKTFNGKWDRYILSDTLQEAFKQLQEYLKGERKEFELPLNPIGTPFQQKVWSSLMMIPYGETRCYKDIAARIGKPNASRAVGLANHDNKIPIFIPCHRVISTDGSMGGYSAGLELKQKLLNLETNYSLI